MPDFIYPEKDNKISALFNYLTQNINMPYYSLNEIYIKHNNNSKNFVEWKNEMEIIEKEKRDRIINNINKSSKIIIESVFDYMKFLNFYFYKFGEKVRSFIFLEYFIIEEGYMWGRILDILSRKAKEGVDVRVMYDGLCELALLPHDYPKMLQKLGIKAKMFAPITPFVSTHYNYRDHRKILVIDGSVAFNGGVNLADEYINKKNKYGHWKDTAVMLQGKAVKSFTLMFLQMWNLTETKPDFDTKFLQSPDIQNAQGIVMPFADCPLDEDKVGETIYMDILYRSKKYVHIMTPYLILDGELETALKYAAQRGVDVKIILPGIPDKKSAYALAKSHYKYLTEAGVKIYEYVPGFVHAKVFVSDDFRAVVGTINLDYRSLYHHFECATYLYKAPCIKDIEEDFIDTLNKSKLVTFETIKKEKLFYKISGKLLKIIAPIM